MNDNKSTMSLSHGASYLERFIRDCKTKGLTPHSIETYRSNVQEFLTYYPNPHDVGMDHLRAYLEKLRSRNLSRATLKGYMSAVSSFYDFLVFEKEILVNPTIGFRRRYLQRIKDQGETRQLLTIKNMHDLLKSAKDIQERAIITFLAKTGIRRGELHDLKDSDLDFDRKRITIPTKAKRTNTIAFMDYELEVVLLEFLSWRENRTRGRYLWISKKGGRIHRDKYGEILAKHGEKLHLHSKNGGLDKKLTPHCLRHFFTTHLFRAGMNPQYIKFLRGDSLKDESWQVYNRIDLDLVRDEYLKYIPKIFEVKE